MYIRNGSVVATYAPDMSSPRWLGNIGHVNNLKYSYSMPGGAEGMSCTLQIPPTFRTDAMDPGRVVRIFRGGSWIWEGILDEPVPSESGWEIQASGAGTYGDGYLAVFSTWNGDDPINQARSRGLRWKTSGVVGSGAYLIDIPDSGSTTITDMLNNITLPASRTWYVGRDNTLRTFSIPSTVTRLLVATTPAARTLAGYINALYMRYQITTDSDNGTATFGTTTVSNPASIAKHQRREQYWDLSSVGCMTEPQTQSLGNAALAKYTATNYAGPFPVIAGQYLTVGGAPVDLGCEQAGEVVQLLLMDEAYGGEVVPTPPITFPVGKYEYDDVACVATVTPFLAMRNDLSGLLGTIATLITPPQQTTTDSGASS